MCTVASPLAMNRSCEEKWSSSYQDKKWICRGSLADLREGLQVLGENLADEDSDCSEEELEKSSSSVGASF